MGRIFELLTFLSLEETESCNDEHNRRQIQVGQRLNCSYGRKLKHTAHNIVTGHMN